jgi:hypothetical protein
MTARASIRIRCFLWRSAGKSVMVLAIPLYAIDASFSWLSNAVTVICAVLCMPLVIFYDWCVKRHNALHDQKRGEA